MSRDKIQNTKTSNQTTLKLKSVMLAYHDFQIKKPHNISAKELTKLTLWQSERLKRTHHDLYHASNYTQGLAFLFDELYSAQDFSGRDRDLERIFPKMIKLLPKTVISTVSLLVELNLLTQKLDHELAHAIFFKLNYADVNEQSYCEAYRHCNNQDQRRYQIQLTSELGEKMDKYARSSLINFSLKITETPAEMAGLSELHAFIMRGFAAFHTMKGIQALMETLTQRESVVLNNIFTGQERPFLIRNA
jgi:hypothetical protein